MKPQYVRIKNPTQSIGRGGGKFYAVHGGRIYTKFFKNLAKNTGRHILGAIKTIAPSLVRNVAPQLITTAASFAGEKLAKKGVPDSFVNFGAAQAQKLAQSASKYGLEDEKKQPLSKTQKLVSDFVSNKGNDLLGQLLLKATAPASANGKGTRNLGSGTRNLGKGLEASEARRIAY